MRPFSYARPTTVEEAIALLGEEGATPLAGGTDLLSLLKSEVESFDLLVDLKRVEELQRIEQAPDGGLRLGATVTLEELLQDARVRERAPALVDAVAGVTAPQIRAMGTLAGDLCQRPRCWYYRSGFGLLAERNYAPMAEGGDARYHAIFGEGPARFVSASRLAPALIALGATVELRGEGGSRRIPVHSFFRSPRVEGEREVTLGPQEIVAAIELPVQEGWRSAAYEVLPRRSLDWPMAAAAAALRVESGVVREARLALGHVAPVPLLAKDAAAVLVGQPLDAAGAASAGEVAVRGARSSDDNRYKVQLARVAVKRALLAAAERTA